MVTLDLFPKAPPDEIALIGFALGFDHSHVCSNTPHLSLPKVKKKLEPSFRVNVIVNIEGLYTLQIVNILDHFYTFKTTFYIN